MLETPSVFMPVKLDKISYSISFHYQTALAPKFSRIYSSVQCIKNYMLSRCITNKFKQKKKLT